MRQFLEPRVDPLEFFQTLRLAELEFPVFFAPVMEDPPGGPDPLAGLRCNLPLRKDDLGLPMRRSTAEI